MATTPVVAPTLFDMVVNYIMSLPMNDDEKTYIVNTLRAAQDKADIAIALEAAIAHKRLHGHSPAGPVTYPAVNAEAMTAQQAAFKDLRDKQLDLAEKGSVGKGNPPPILPPKTFNPVLSLAGIPQIWYTDEPTGGWPTPSAKQEAGEGRKMCYTNPLYGYWVEGAVLDAMPPQAASPDWAAVNARMAEQAKNPPAEPAPPVVVEDPVIGEG